MVNIVVTLNAGILVGLSSRGHADEAGEGRLPCALVTESLKAFGLVVNGRKDLKVSAKSEGPGSLEFSIVPGSAFDGHWYTGVQQYTLELLRTIARDFPAHVELEVLEKSEGRNGT